MSQNPFVLELKLIVLSAWTLFLMLGWWTFVCEYAVAKLYVCFAIAVRTLLMFVLVLMLGQTLKEAAGTLGIEDDPENRDPENGDSDHEGDLEPESDEEAANNGVDEDGDELLLQLIAELEEVTGGDTETAKLLEEIADGLLAGDLEVPRDVAEEIAATQPDDGDVVEDLDATQPDVEAKDVDAELVEILDESPALFLDALEESQALVAETRGL